MYFSTWQLIGLVVLVWYLFWNYSARTDEEKEERRRINNKIWLVLLILGGGYVLFWIIIFGIGLWQSLPENYKVGLYTALIYIIIFGIIGLFSWGAHVFEKKKPDFVKKIEKHGTLIVLSILGAIGLLAVGYIFAILFGVV
jgi:uncharacterized membrane protein YiaA